MVKKQINVVSLEDFRPVEEITPNSDDERTQIKEAIQLEEEQLTKGVEQQQLQEEKPKPKRKTPTKKTKVKEENIVEEPVVESPKEPTPKQPEKKIKTVELHRCDKCNKEMTLRALRYTHPKYCTGKEIIRNEVPVKRQVKSATVINNVVEITPDVIENHLRKVKENKLKERQEKISKLISKIA